MSDHPHPDDFYISIGSEVDEPDLVADVVYRGAHIASIRRDGERWSAIIFSPGGAEALRLPPRELANALQEAMDRLEQA